MNHWEMENVIQLGITFKEAGFQISQVFCSRQSCFDFAARKDNTSILVKVSSDVDAFSPRSARELKMIADRVSAASLLISQQTHGKPLEDDTVYSRNGIFVITEKTVRNIALRTANPLIYAGPGGYSVEVDGQLVEKRRKELGLSIGKLAAMIGVSRRTLYGYERGMTKASVKSAYKLARTLGIPVAKPINVLRRKRKQYQLCLIKARHVFIRKVLLQKVLKKFSFFNISPVYKAPFDFIINIPKSKQVIIGTVAARDDGGLDKRVEEIISLCSVIDAHPVLITEKIRFTNKAVSCICLDEFPTLHSLEDIVTTA